MEEKKLVNKVKASEGYHDNDDDGRRTNSDRIPQVIYRNIGKEGRRKKEEGTREGIQGLGSVYLLLSIYRPTHTSNPDKHTHKHTNKHKQTQTTLSRKEIVKERRKVRASE